jgi:bifunctional DNA-binding transcriptional regulator/antitoxin component of YhaV-PrlF toxin-antitoxin module
VIPAPLRKTSRLEPGNRLVARRVGESLVLERREAVEGRLKDRFSRIAPGVCLADELIAERRSEAELDQAAPSGDRGPRCFGAQPGISSRRIRPRTASQLL